MYMMQDRRLTVRKAVWDIIVGARIVLLSLFRLFIVRVRIERIIAHYLSHRDGSRRLAALLKITATSILRILQ